MATQVIGSLAVNNLVPSAAHGAGSVPFGPLALPTGYSVLQVMFDLTLVQSLTAVFSATVELSLDNGATWQTVNTIGLDLSKSGYVLNASVLTRPAGDRFGAGPVRAFAAQAMLIGTDLSTRQIRGSVSCSEAATSGVTLSAF